MPKLNRLANLLRTLADWLDREREPTPMDQELRKLIEAADNSGLPFGLYWVTEKGQRDLLELVERTKPIRLRRA